MSPEMSKEASVAEAEQVGRKGIREAGEEGPRRPHQRAYIFILSALENHGRVLSKEMT